MVDTCQDGTSVSARGNSSPYLKEGLHAALC
jgi:hypothetical protein